MKISSSLILQAALFNLGNNRPCIAVKADKTPYRQGWNRYFTQKQTEAEVEAEFSNGVFGIAEVLYPASDYIHLDIDGPHAEQALRETKLELPGTARIVTRSGYHHFIFKVSPLFKKSKLSRKVRLIKANCGCKIDGRLHVCGIDLLSYGYSLIPPTPGYSEDPDRPLETAVEIPDALVEMALKANGARSSTQTRPTGAERIASGERNQVLTSLAGSMRRRGMTFDSILAALEEENARRCDPPLSQREVESIAKSVSRYPPQHENETGGEKKKVWVMTMDRVTEEKTDWFWPKRIPLRRPTVFGGDPGTGKSFCSLAVAASGTRGEPLPGGDKPSSPCNVLLISTEDGYSDVCKPRLRVLGADMARIFIPEPERNLTPTLIPSALEHLVKASDPRLVILDPLMAFAAGKAVKEASIMRQLLGPMANLAERFDFALLIICHLNKSQVKALYRLQESIDLVALARSVFIFANDSTEKDRHLIAHAKSSLGGKTPSLSFYIRDDGNAGAFEWGQTVDLDVDQLLSTDEARKRRNTQLEAAKTWLQEILANGPLASNTVKSRAEAAGLAWGTVWRAKDELNIKPRKAGGKNGEWIWRLN